MVNTVLEGESSREGYVSEMEEEAVEKIDFQNRDFKFIVAYKAYLKRFEESHESEDRQRLNELITKLDLEEITYPNYYKRIDENNEESGKRYQFHRTKIKSTRKFAYRRSQQEKNRIKRHKNS
jgi:hypothetical protein